jgi:hypothetical protein
MGSAAFVQALEVVVIIAAGLLVPAGVAKLRHPEIAREALGLGRWTRDELVRSVGAGELLLASWVLLDGGRAATATLAITYAAFTGVAARQRQRGASCGCFGGAGSPTSWTHLALDLTAALAAATLAITSASVGAVQVVLGAGPLEAVTLLVAGAAAVATAQLVLTALPELAAARRRTTTGGRP